MDRETTIEYMKRAVSCHNAPSGECLGRKCCDCPYDYPAQLIDVVESALKLLEDGGKDSTVYLQSCTEVHQYGDNNTCIHNAGTINM